MQAEYEQGLLKQIEAFKDKDIGGWKVGLTSGANRDGMGQGFRPFGHVLRERIFDSGHSLSLGTFESGAIGVENEICFRFGQDVPTTASRQEVIGSIECVLPAFELNERRLPSDASSTERLADNLSQWGIVVGESGSQFTDVNFENLSVSLICDGRLLETVDARGHIDDHADSLLALVENLAHFNMHVRAGDLVITGAFARSRVNGPSHWQGDFGETIGQVEVRWQ